MSRRNSGLTRRGAVAALGLSAAAAACGKKPDAPPYNGEVQFNHGVASGDPGVDRVVIWSRVTPAEDGPVPVRWIVARNEGLTDVVQTGVAETDSRRDFTIKVDVQGLRQGAPYFYGFRAGRADSPVGRTKTLPTEGLDRIKIAVASCASFPHGFFNAYEAMAREEELDLVVHLGDYIYEYGVDGYGSESSVSLGRTPAPNAECVSLGDYRIRHAQYKSERELQDAHAKCAWICVWDDHEVANDDWTGGAENHTESREGSWSERKSAALQAYYEWMPIRNPEAGRPFEAINRSFQFGTLFSLAMLETRLFARTRPLSMQDIPVVSLPWDFSNPNAPRLMPAGTPEGGSVRLAPAPHVEVNGQLQPVRDWARVQAALRSPRNPPDGMVFAPDLNRLNALLNADDRVMLGAQQEAWLASEMSAAKQKRTTWQLIGNQVLMAPIAAPDLSNAPARAKEIADELQPGARQLMEFTRYRIPLSLDSWDGYPRARARVLDIFKQMGANTIVLTGDSHAAWANEISHGGARVAVELGATSITSPSAGDALAPAGVDFAGGIAARNRGVVKWTQQTKRGYLRLVLERTKATATFVSVSSIRGKGFDVAEEARFEVAADDAPGTGALERVDS